MEDLKINIDKLNKVAADLPEVKRKEDGSIDLEAITIEIDPKGNRIIPDDLFNAYYKELPSKVINQSKSWRTSNGGKIKILGGDPEGDKAIHEAGGKALQATLAQRRTCKEILEEIARKKAPIEYLEDMELPEDTSCLEAANYAQALRAIRGDTKALEYIRDTLGEKPTEKINAEVTALTPEDKELLERVSRRLEAE
ncbi:hypothetical protein [Butyrivibrio sp. AE2032]|uniref:hypothetical protein n=1 Tax=Butyrivibrio sp. AE2032 TaxID=1458463 RepID=UPI0005507EED|nr:hypothetical protein [Butyrivibrio sp. AE2032]